MAHTSVQEGWSSCRARITVGPLIQKCQPHQHLSRSCLPGSLVSLKRGHREHRVKRYHQLPLSVCSVCSRLGTSPSQSRMSEYTRSLSWATSRRREKYRLPKDWANPTAFWKQRMAAGRQPPTKLKHPKQPEPLTSCVWDWKLLVCQDTAHSERKFCYQASRRYN